MTRVITLDKGSKRRLKQIRWKLFEAFTLALLTCFVLAMSLLIMWLELRHVHPHREPSKVPQIRNMEPVEP